MEKEKCVLSMLPSYYSIYSSASGQQYPCSKCTKNAECIVPGRRSYGSLGNSPITYCTCVNDTVPVLEKCLERKEFQESCVDDSECIPASSQSETPGTMRCINSTCQCPIIDGTVNTTGTYDAALKKCISFPGEPCGVPKYQRRYGYARLEGNTAYCVGNSICPETYSYSSSAQ